MGLVWDYKVGMGVVKPKGSGCVLNQITKNHRSFSHSERKKACY